VVTPTAGAVVLVPFPFSDLSQAKLWPAVVLADVGRGDWILCQITSNPYGDARAILLTDCELCRGGTACHELCTPWEAVHGPSHPHGLARWYTASRPVAADHRGCSGYAAYQPETIVANALLAPALPIPQSGE
jgi:hypothetical protein